MSPLRQTFAIIHLDHLTENYKMITSMLQPGTFCCPMVKANAYGHGDVEVALRLQQEGCHTMGVGLIEEGILLRQMGVQSDLLVFGIFDEKGARELIHWNLTAVLSTWEQLEALEKVAPRPWPVHVKFNTGMNRLGFIPSDARKIVERLDKSTKLKLKGILTHLACGEDADNVEGESFSQLNKFEVIKKEFAKFPIVNHALNSAGTVHFIAHQKSKRALPSGISLQQGIRPGLLIYGLNPVSQNVFPGELKAVMSLRSHVAQYSLVKKGDRVSYGGTWQAPKDSVVAAVPIGYADGYHRLLSNQGEVLLEGRRAMVVGNVCMDYILVDVTDKVKPESVQRNEAVEVTLFGYDKSKNLLSAAEVAAKAKTISWEILTSVAERVPRRTTNGVSL